MRYPRLHLRAASCVPIWTGLSVCPGIKPPLIAWTPERPPRSWKRTIMGWRRLKSVSLNTSLYGSFLTVCAARFSALLVLQASARLHWVAQLPRLSIANLYGYRWAEYMMRQRFAGIAVPMSARCQGAFFRR